MPKFFAVLKMSLKDFKDQNEWMNSFFLRQVYSLLSYIPFLLFFSLLLKTINFPFSTLNSHRLPYIARKPIVYKRLYNLPFHNHFVNNLVRIVFIIFNVYCCCTRAKKVVSSSLGLVDFAIGLVNSVFNLLDGQVMFYEEFE